MSLARPAAPTLVLIIAVLAISSSAALVRWAALPAVSLAFWRTLGGAVLLAPAAVGSPTRPIGRDHWLISVAGLALGVHFAAWLASLTMTSVAASVTLVSTVPIMIALYELVAGRRPNRATWVAIAMAAMGTAVITLTDATANGGLLASATERRAMVGNGLALLGAAAMAVYLVVGHRLRGHLSTAAYASRTYGVAAVALALAVVVFDARLTARDGGSWLAVAGMILGPQLAGHTSLNYLLRRLGSVTVSLSLLAEPVGASLLVLLFFGETPSLGAWLGAPLVLAAVALQITAGAWTGEAAGGPAEPASAIRPVEPDQ